MKKLLLASSALCLGTVPVMAADLPVAPKAPPPAIYSWAGFYAGVHGGYGWGKQRFFGLSFRSG